MITHRSNATDLFLNNNNDNMFIWLQVSRPNTKGKPCCPRHGTYPYDFAPFLMDHNDWVMYHTASDMGKVHVFQTVEVIHKSRVDQLGRVMNGHKIYNNCSLIKEGGFEHSPVEFLESAWDMDIIEFESDHIHVLLYYPAALVDTPVKASESADEFEAYGEVYREDELHAYGEDELYAYGEDELYAYGEDELYVYGEDELYAYSEDELYAYGEDELYAYGEDELYAYGEDELEAYIEDELEAYSDRETSASDGAFWKPFQNWNYNQLIFLRKTTYTFI
ncbi:MAG: hypothetical protein BYD32DRAFT_429705 [Podila humilis]|nr:MAG: hypothetical protein BYD32DRAFT_429705 [Podila humilis]